MNVWLQSVLYSCHLYRGFILDIQQLQLTNNIIDNSLTGIRL